MECIKINKIAKDFQNGQDTFHVIRNINMTIFQGDMVSIMGRSGSGKTTLLHILAGMLPPDNGSYYFMENMLAPRNYKKMQEFRRQYVCYLTQEDTLLYDRDVEQNIALPLLFSKHSKATLHSNIMEIVEKLQITSLLKQNPAKLSGGERQKVAIARALLGNKPLLLADEPTGSLDEESEQGVLSVFRQLNKEGVTVIIVTHDHTVASICNRQFYLKSGILQSA